ncbi:1,4-alpha-glucan branching protein GlgB [Pacificibacter marinus]|uniref:1,4-alpha-glucan branching protein GlgB n=1 Tax=Pacificibacter marinus TaxID=658057 RepID=UPI001C0755BA|nr:1,4-alpha-glucan branching protein GlgB [Pacificibacter marinus]MBU2868735.1 1,4-alpha-glucan branching protein GlgB [Pacificibacter marinus]
MPNPDIRTDDLRAALPHDVAQDLILARLTDPFGFLGLRAHADGFALNVFVPDADRCICLTGKKTRIEMAPVPFAPGLFCVLLPKDVPYQIEAQFGEAQWVFHDPYAFGSSLTADDLHYLGEGSMNRIWDVLGATPMSHEGVDGVRFAVWAPNAQRVAVVGDFNIWDSRRHGMRRLGQSGVWELFVPALKAGEVYKYAIRGADGRDLPLKADPIGFGSEHPPKTGSIVREIKTHDWADDAWMSTRAKAQNIDAPISIYEVNLASWKRADGNRPLSYIELADQLVDYAADMGFTHIELMPITEHPFDGSWGYQPIGMFAPTIRHGTPEEFRALVTAAHGKGLGVLLDWVPAHFPTDEHGLAQFDGTALYEHGDPREGFHQDWNTLIYNFGRIEVANYMRSNALYWLEEYHLDGLRVDAVASMLYRDYSRNDGEWVPNKDGGRENYEAIAFLQGVNTLVYGEVPGIMTVAEESTAFPRVSTPVDHGGLGFGFKWNMGWMNDTLRYMEEDPINRKYHHHLLTHSISYAYTENFVLPISHDEVVHGKGSMIDKMTGNAWEQFANLRAYYGFMWTHPGKKLLFMGQEFAQRKEWNHNQSLDWHLLDAPAHAGIQHLVRDLNKLYRSVPALHVNDTRPAGFGWIEGADVENSIYVYVRHGKAGDPRVVTILNMTPVERTGHRVGLPSGGYWREAINTDAEIYGGGGRGNLGGVQAQDIEWMGQAHSAELTLPPLSAVILIEGEET